MLPLLLIVHMAWAAGGLAQLNKDQIERLAILDHELSDGWAVRDQEETPFLIGGAWTKGYAVDLFHAPTAREDGDNEGVSLYFFNKAEAESVEVRFPPTPESTYEYNRTKSFVVVIAYFNSNGKLYDIHTRSMLK